MKKKSGVGADSPLTVMVSSGKLTISIGVHTLAFCSPEALQRFDDDKNQYVSPRVLNAGAFAVEVKEALTEEEEDGSSAITRALDTAMQKARDEGSQALSEDEVEYDDARVPWIHAGGRPA